MQYLDRGPYGHRRWLPSLAGGKKGGGDRRVPPSSPLPSAPAGLCSEGTGNSWWRAGEGKKVGGRPEGASILSPGWEGTCQEVKTCERRGVRQAARTRMEPEWTGMQGAGKGEGWSRSRSRAFPCQAQELGLHSLDRWSPNFLHQGPFSWKTVFSMNQRWGDVLGMSQAHSLYSSSTPAVRLSP